jgi:5-methylcytosine-specific restriction protein A
MGRLKSLTPRLQTLGNRISPAVTVPVDRKEAEAQRTRRRDQEDAGRKLYNTRAWKALRREVLERDAYTCQKTGVICLGQHPAPNSPVADHIVPHRGDPALFWDKSNIQTVSKAYHDSLKQREERAGSW